MGNVPPKSDDDPVWLQRRYQLLRRQYHQAVPTTLRHQREATEVQAMASWALRSGASGWAMVRDGSLRVTNRAFDALDRDSAVGPGWHEVRQDASSTPSLDGPGRSLAEIVLDEARSLIGQGIVQRRMCFSRGAQVVEVTVERAPVMPSDDPLVLAHVRDVSEMAQSEERLADLQERLRLREQMARAGEVAVEVGHDLGNLVGALNARLMVLEAEGALDGQAVQALRDIAEAQTMLVVKLKTVARQLGDQPDGLRLRPDVITPAARMAESILQQRTRRQAIWVRVEPEVAKLPSVMGAREGLVNLVLNLLLNARDAMPEGGVIRFRGAIQDGTVVLAVEDQGIGIPPEALPRLFEPFFTTKGDRGMGMGLALARQLMRQLGGDITARNRPEGGACFELRFPRDL
jgi:signal transduction histidine kinase